MGGTVINNTKVGRRCLTRQKGDREGSNGNNESGNHTRQARLLGGTTTIQKAQAESILDDGGRGGRGGDNTEGGSRRYTRHEGTELGGAATMYWPEAEALQVGQRRE